jgi:folate-binding protein YgfZ
VKIRELDIEERAVWAAWGISGNAGQYTTKPQSSAEDIIYLEDPRLKDFSLRLLLPSGKQDPAALHESIAQLEMVELDEYMVRRYIEGVAEGSLEIIPEHSLPHESNLDHLNAIDFRKGCYVGQELTIRTQHTGVVRKRILPVTLYLPDNTEAGPIATAESIPHGANVKATGSKRPAGKWLTGKSNIGLAICRLSQMTDMVVGPEESQYVEGREFGVLNEEGLDIKLKASLPGWLRDKEKAKKNRHTDIVTDI